MMSQIFVVGLGMLVTAGILTLLHGVRPSALPSAERPATRRTAAADPSSPARQWTRRLRAGAGPTGQQSAATRRRIRRLVVAVVLGVIAALATGWLLLLFLVPLALVGLPWLLGAPPTREADLLAATDRWIRSVAATLATGVSIGDALRASVRTAPTLIAEDLRLMTLRLDQRWSIPEALGELADRLDSPDTDAVLAALSLAAQRGGTGASLTLAELSDSVGERLRTLREVDAERAKPRVVVRQVTVISVVVLGAAMLLGGEFFAPYRTWWGQLVLAGLLAAYVGSLVMMRRATIPRARERILQRARGAR